MVPRGSLPHPLPSPHSLAAAHGCPPTCVTAGPRVGLRGRRCQAPFASRCCGGRPAGGRRRGGQRRGRPRRRCPAGRRQGHEWRQRDASGRGGGWRSRVGRGARGASRGGGRGGGGGRCERGVRVGQRDLGPLGHGRHLAARGGGGAAAPGAPLAAAGRGEDLGRVLQWVYGCVLNACSVFRRAW